jgi:glutamate racemase
MTKKNKKLKIGVFDSGLGGLFILKALKQKLPQYDYLYVGDTLHVPFGDRSQESLYRITRKAVDYLFKHDCGIVLLACNTASTMALRQLQQEYLPKHYPDQRILGPIIPTVEITSGARVGIIATKATVHSRTYLKEFKKIHPKTRVFQVATPGLVPLLENGQQAEAEQYLSDTLATFKGKNIDTLILGSTHYTLLTKAAKKYLSKKVNVISQDTFIPTSFKKYLVRHPEITSGLSEKSSIKLLVTKLNPHYKKLVKDWFSGKATLGSVKL